MSGIKWRILVTTSAYFSEYIFSRECLLLFKRCSATFHLLKQGTNFFSPGHHHRPISFRGDISDEFPYLANGNRNAISTVETWGRLNEKGNVECLEQHFTHHRRSIKFSAFIFEWDHYAIIYLWKAPRRAEGMLTWLGAKS